MISQSSKVAFLTGATSGIGRATAQELVKYVSILIMPVRNIAKGQALKQQLLTIVTMAVILRSAMMSTSTLTVSFWILPQ
jgi:NADP-dependent 3-hydroxy acid dehydrogenase YdfG